MSLTLENILRENKRASAKVFEVSSLPPAEWDIFSEENAGGLLYSSTWVDLVGRGYGAKTLYACMREDGVIKTGLAGIIYDFGFFRLFYSNVPYGGILGDVSLTDVLLVNLEKDLKKRNIHQIRLTQTADRPYVAPENYREKKAFQHSLDLRGLDRETLLKQFRKNTRRDVQKASRSGICIREMREPRELEDYYSLYKLTMRRNASLCHYTKKLYHEIDAALINSGKAAILFADYAGKPIAGLLLFFSNDRTYLIGNVSDPEYLKLCPNDLLFHAALVKTLDLGLSYFDFMTSEYADEALMKFKEKWGAERFPFVIYQKNLSPLHCRLWDAAWSLAIFLKKAFRANR